MKQGLAKKLAAALSIALLASAVTFASVTGAAWDNIVLEAETAEKTDGFVVEDSAQAGGGQSIVLQGGGGATLEFEIPETGRAFLWVRAHSATASNDTAYYSIDGKGQEIFYLKPSMNFEWKRVSLGVLSAGKHQMVWSAKKQGMRVDAFVVTADASYRPEGILKKSAEEETGEEISYWPENKQVIKESWYEIPEKDGSYFVEAEAGTLLEPMTIYDWETASGEKYIAASGISRFVEPYSTVKPHAGYKFTVSEKGQYHVWVRYFTPASNQKSSWISIDGKEYYQLDTSITSEWTWRKVKDVYLDTGVHSLDVKYRESGQRLDCFIITKDGYTPTGLGSLPGEEVRPDALTYAERVQPRIIFNGETMESNIIGKKENDRYLMSFRHLGEAMGATYYEDEKNGYAMLNKGRDYIKVFDGSKNYVVNGREKKMRASAQKISYSSWLVDFTVLTEVFGGSYQIDENNQISITYTEPFEEDWLTAETANDAEITIEKAEAIGFTYSVACDDPDAVVLTWLRNAGDHGWKRSVAQTAWQRGYNPTFHEGKFYGSFAATTNEKQRYYLKVKVITPSEVKTYYKYVALNKLEEEYPDVYSFIPHEEGVYLVPTFENMSVYLDYTNEKYDCDVTFRKKGDKEWRQAYELYKDEPVKQFRGSITGLTENTTYEVRAVLTLNGSAQEEYISEATTWADNPPIAKEYKLSEIYDPKAMEGNLTLEHLKGSPDGWIKIKGEAGNNQINATRNVDDAVYIANCEYVILEDLYITGGYFNAVHITNNSENIRISNCDISDWGREGVRSDKSGLFNDFKGNQVNYDSGVRIGDVKNIVVEHCYIHDPVGDSNHWAYGHPAGPNALLVRSKGGLVVRYNDLIACDGHRWNDSIEGYYNGEKSGGPSRDCDFYGNVMQYGQDDGIEYDGAQMNLRFYNNRIEGFLCGISTVPFMVGPSYTFRNLIVNLGTETGGTGSAFKSGGGSGSYYSYSRMYLFNNTIYTGGNAIGQGGFGTPPNIFVYTTRNNILMGTGYSIYDDNYVERSDYDYDIICKQDGTASTNYYSDNQESHGIFDAPQFTDVSKGIYTASGSNTDTGEVVPNFAEQYQGKAPDIGAFENGEDNKKSIPARPADIWAEQYTVTHPAGTAESEVVIHVGDIPEGEHFTIRYSKHIGDWMSVTTEDGKSEGILQPNSTVRLKVKTDSASIRFVRGRGAFIFKTDSGDSIAVTVYAEV